MRLLITLWLSCIFLLPNLLIGQAAECPYPIIFLHGWTGDQTSFADTYQDVHFVNVFGSLGESQIFYTMNNASFSTNIWGDDGLPGTNDDDVLVTFNNEDNVLPPGCVYAINQDNGWNENPNNPILNKNSGDAISFTESDSNESALYKQGYTLQKMIEAVLTANPTKDKVIVAGFSMGGLAIREYLQRQSNDTPTWWVNPNAFDGHQVIRAMTLASPHRGSNTLGNISGLDRPDTPERDGLPDLFSEAVRDLRYSWSCGFLGLSNCAAAYLYGGDEDAGWGWWNEDANCDGDENDSDIDGLNINGLIQGHSEIWHGTIANPDMPLPDNIKYTYLTSDIPVFNGDGAVAWDRQWLFEGNVPHPSDGTPGRLSDTLLTDVFHTSAKNDADMVIRGLDEGDYPAFVWDVQREIDYINLPTYRAGNVPEGPVSMDPDWYRFSLPSGYSDGIRITLYPNSGINTQLDFFGNNPGDYTNASTPSNWSLTAPGGSNSPVILNIPNSALQNGGENYFRLLHSGVNFNSWREPVIFSIESAIFLPVEWESIQAKIIREREGEIRWTLRLEEDVDYYAIERATNGVHFSEIGRVPARGNSSEVQPYTFLDPELAPGQNTYRIRSVDFDGSISYSSLVSLEWKSKTWTLVDYYPTPTTGPLSLDIHHDKPTLIVVEIWDAQGRFIKKQTLETIPGTQTLTLDLRELSDGMYFLTLRNDSHQERIKLVKTQ